ncbi:MAG: hypothetical protein GC155_16765 [Alphaproteobacteria bacterium]|nr:hypothetical protein [Alphaproteobacteria bacterium]
MLDRATPRVGAVVHAPPTSITLEFSEGVEAALAHVTLSDSHGAAVQLGRASSATSDKRILSVPVKPALTAGTYTVTWRVVSVDSHVTQGDFKFTVRP